MEQQLLDLIGEEGDEMQFDEWVSQARAQGLQPNVVQRLKRTGKVYTKLDENGVNWIVRGSRPQA